MGLTAPQPLQNRRCAPQGFSTCGAVTVKYADKVCMSTASRRRCYIFLAELNLNLTINRKQQYPPFQTASWRSNSNFLWADSQDCAMASNARYTPIAYSDHALRQEGTLCGQIPQKRSPKISWLICPQTAHIKTIPARRSRSEPHGPSEAFGKTNHAQP